MLRAFPKEEVVAQMLAGFELASADPRVWWQSTWCNRRTNIALCTISICTCACSIISTACIPACTCHPPRAGVADSWRSGFEELLASHIRESIEVGHAERIGHGLDVLYEADVPGLLAEMAQRSSGGRDCVYSHEVVRGMTGSENVLPIYLRAGVPVALATDDEGIVRSELTWYFRRAVEGYHVDYPTLKRMVRDSLDHAFLPDASSWVVPEKFTMVPACSSGLLQLRAGIGGLPESARKQRKGAPRMAGGSRTPPIRSAVLVQETRPAAERDGKFRRVHKPEFNSVVGPAHCGILVAFGLTPGDRSMQPSL